MSSAVALLLEDLSAPPMGLPVSQKATWFVREIARLRAKARAMGFELAPLPTKEELSRVFLFALDKEKDWKAALPGLGQSAEMTGAAGGMMTGASVGAFGGPVGIAIGAIAGGAIGAFAGKGQSKSAESALKAAQKQKQAAQIQASAMKTSAKLGLETAKVKAETASKLPWWGWVGLVAGGLAFMGVGGVAIYRLRKD